MNLLKKVNEVVLTSNTNNHTKSKTNQKYDKDHNKLTFVKTVQTHLDRSENKRYTIVVNKDKIIK